MCEQQIAAVVRLDTQTITGGHLIIDFYAPTFTCPRIKSIVRHATRTKALSRRWLCKPLHIGPSARAPIRGQATLRADDFKAAWRALPEVRKFAFGGAVLLLIWSVGAAMCPAPAFIVVPIGALGLGYGMLQGRARWTASGIQGLGGGAVKYVFDDYGYHLDAPGRQMRLEWAALHRHIETKDALLIFSSAQVATLVPKRAFDAADQSRLLAELQARLPPPKQRRNGVTKAVVIWVVLIVAFLAVWQLLIAPSPP